MSLILFRRLPSVAAIEEQLRLQSLGMLSDDEADVLPHLIDVASRELFGISANDTLYPALPEVVRDRCSRAEWEAQFEILARFSRDPNAYWSRFGLDLCCEQGHSLHCVELFGRQLVCALDGLHPAAVLTFAYCEIARAA